MMKMWTISPYYIDDQMLIETFFEGMKLFRVMEGKTHHDAYDSRYYRTYFMYDLLKSYPQKESMLARYLFQISEVLLHQRNIEVDISELVRRQPRPNQGLELPRMTIPTCQINLEKEILTRRLTKIECKDNVMPLPEEAGLIQSHPSMVVIPGDITTTARESINLYVDLYERKGPPYAFTRIVS